MPTKTAPKKTPKKTPAKTPKPKADVYQIVTDKVLALLEAGTVPWRKPWASTGGGVPLSMSTTKPYRGINPFLLICTAMAEGYTSPWWGTYDHIAKLGGQVRRGQESTTVVWWNRGTNMVKDEVTGKEVARIWMTLRLFRVFNADQADGLPEKYKVIAPNSGIESVGAVDGLTARYEGTLASLAFGGDRAYYSPSLDHVQLPPLGAYKGVAEFYSTKFHELGHSTGHSRRLNRPGIIEGHRFGDDLYAREELIAEMTAAMLCGIAGVEQTTLPNSAAYLANWTAVLRGDSKMVVSAAAAAQKAADLILGTVFEDNLDTVA